MKRMVFGNVCLCLFLVLSAMPDAVAQAPAISPARVKARKELGQLGVEYSKSSFVKQASEGDTIAVQLFLAAGMDPNASETTVSVNALMAAAREGHLETLNVLLAGGANVNAGALRFATRLDVLKFLLDHGADVTGADGSGALVSATRTGRLDCVSLLLERGADVSARDQYGYGRTVLMNAVEQAAISTSSKDTTAEAVRQRMDIVKMLVGGKADVNAKDSLGMTSLLIAAHSGAADMVRFLLDHGADVNARQREGKTALIEAIEGGFTDLVKTLIDKGADVNARTGSSSPLSLASVLRKPDIVQLLINAGAKQ